MPALLDLALDPDLQEALGVGLPENLGHRALDRRPRAVAPPGKFGIQLAQGGLRLSEPALPPPGILERLLRAAHPDDPMPVGGGIRPCTATVDIRRVALAATIGDRQDRVPADPLLTEPGAELLVFFPRPRHHRDKLPAVRGDMPEILDGAEFAIGDVDELGAAHNCPERVDG